MFIFEAFSQEFCGQSRRFAGEAARFQSRLYMFSSWEQVNFDVEGEGRPNSLRLSSCLPTACGALWLLRAQQGSTLHANSTCFLAACGASVVPLAAETRITWREAKKIPLDIHLPARIALGIYHRIKTTHDLRVPVPTPVGSYWNPDIIPHQLNLEACCNEFQNLRFAGQISTGCWISYLNEKYPLIWDHHPISRCLKPQSRYQPFEYLHVLCIYTYIYMYLYIYT